MIHYQAMKEFPKAELHCHLDGSIRPSTLQKIAAQQQLAISSDLAEVTKAMQAPQECQNLTEYLARFDYVLPYLQTSTALTMAAYDVMEQAAEDGIRYIEIRFAPSLSQAKGLTVAETIRAVAKGIAQAEQTYAIIGNILIIGMRQEEVNQIKQVFQESLNTQESKLVGFDLAGPEKENFVSDLQESFAPFITEQGIQLTLHAGECGCVANIHAAIAQGAKRIGHGIALKGNQLSQKECATQNICIEGCPTSNIQTKAIKSYQEYPVREWLTNQVPFCLSTDNKTVSHTTLTDEYWHLITHHQLTELEIRQINQTAVAYSFASETVKNNLYQAMANAPLAEK